jgi:hypothetical protein
VDNCTRPSHFPQGSTRGEERHTITMLTTYKALSMTHRTSKHLLARGAHAMEPQAGAPSAPNWYAAMVETQWTVGTIMRTFAVPRPLARRIQKEFPAYEELCTLLEAHRELCAQVGH